ncbi:MAG: hypothetical protein JXR19_04795 [Bacteroidia bacterium]
MRTLVAILTLALFHSFAFGQLNRQTPFALRVSASTSYFLCDLGGKHGYGSNDLSDINLEQTRFGLGVGLQYRKGGFSLGANTTYVRLAADDQLSNSARGIRGLNVITDVLEASVNMEYCVPRNIPVFRNLFFNIGYGVMIYSPKAKYNGNTYKLRPLGTEGQNYLPGVDKYSTFAPVIPFGFGYKFRFKDGASLALDVSLRKSFTDYLDDVSTSYADPNRISQKAGPIASILADRSTRGFQEGEQRGDSEDMDNYFLIGFKYTIPLGKRSNGCYYW